MDISLPATQRTTTTAPLRKNFDCQHSDMLYIYPADSGPGLEAIYFEQRGAMRDPLRRFDTQTRCRSFPFPAVVKGPQFRLTYKLKGAVMTGSFQMQMPPKAIGALTLNGAAAKNKDKRRADRRSHVGYYTGANHP